MLPLYYWPTTLDDKIDAYYLILFQASSWHPCIQIWTGPCSILPHFRQKSIAKKRLKWASKLFQVCFSIYSCMELHKSQMMIGGKESYQLHE